MNIRDRITNLQRRLGVPADGILGPVTLTRLEAALNDCHGTASAQSGSLTVSRRGLHLIVAHEIASEEYYRARLMRPIWPGGQSGITIGIGYDLGHQTAHQILEDWQAHLVMAHVNLLTGVAGTRGEAARAALSRVRDVVVPLDAAKAVFYTRTLPRYAELTARAFPGVRDLPPDAQAALLSLIYNRGASMEGASRAEMRAIRQLVPIHDLAGIAYQIRAMKRLWLNSGLPGLLRRRDEEAALVAGARAVHDADELVEV